MRTFTLKFQCDNCDLSVLEILKDIKQQLSWGRSNILTEKIVLFEEDGEGRNFENFFAEYNKLLREEFNEFGEQFLLYHKSRFENFIKSKLR